MRAHMVWSAREVLASMAPKGHSVQSPRLLRFLVPAALVFFVTATIYFGVGSHATVALLSHDDIANPPLVPRKIWQILLPMPASVEAKGTSLSDAESWLNKNPGYTYTLLGAEGAESFIKLHYSDQPEILDTFNALENPAMRSDFLRYLVLLKEGGVYSDIDTEAIRPVEHWIPEKYRSRAKILAGIEWDQQGGAPSSYFTYPLQLGQWTIASSPGHPVLRQMVDNCVQLGRQKAGGRTMPGSPLHFTDNEIVNTTGPAAWTRTVWEAIQEAAPNMRNIEDLSGLQHPTLFGDILVLPINSFGSGQPHSGSWKYFQHPDTLIKHKFKGTWRTMPWWESSSS
ncbi:alpha 1,6-mannosyltransferase [Microdochium nivale]|nr:alpha 1,6-mannosyltransferase [Microdochium nivale]